MSGIGLGIGLGLEREREREMRERDERPKKAFSIRCRAFRKDEQWPSRYSYRYDLGLELG